MSRNTVRRNLCLSIALAIAMTFGAACAPSARAFTLFESALLGPTGIEPSGWEVNYLQYLGVRFEVTAPATTTRVGTHLVDAPFEYYGNDKVFAALVALSGPEDLPDSVYLSTPDVLGAALLTLPELSAEVSAPLNVSLSPGWYSLVVGSGRFGAHGFGAVTRNNFDVGRPSYYRRFGAQYFDYGGLSDFRIFVEAIPEPPTFLSLLLALGCIHLAPRCWRIARQETHSSTPPIFGAESSVPGLSSPVTNISISLYTNDLRLNPSSGRKSLWNLCTLSAPMASEMAVGHHAARRKQPEVANFRAKIARRGTALGARIGHNHACCAFRDARWAARGLRQTPS